MTHAPSRSTNGTATDTRPEFFAALMKGGYTGVSVSTSSPGAAKACAVALRPTTRPGNHTIHDGSMAQP